MSQVDSTSDERVVNNVMRHAYRVLSDDEKAQMQTIKDKGLEFFEFLNVMATGPKGHTREIALAKTKIEEAVMWGVKSLTN